MGVGPIAMHKVYYKGEGGGFLKSQAVVNLCLPETQLAPKVFQLRIIQLAIWYV